MREGKIKDLCDVIAGQSPEGIFYNSEGDGIEFHQGKKSFGDMFLQPSNVWTTKLTKLAEPLDILMSVRAPVGPTNITNRQVCIGRGLAAIRCKSNALNKYIYYALKNIENKIVGNDGAVFNSINKIENKIIKEITIRLVEKYHDSFFIYPAASRMHHAYVGGLAYHSIGMLKLADGFIDNYPYLRRDYLYAGIILHDIGKAIELTGIQGTEYTLDGQLLGHLVLGALEINKMACKLGVEDTNEVRLLEHMLISHHGQPQFGAAKKPATPEALALWYIDTIDSKFRVLGEELEKTEFGSFTDTIGVLDKIKVYKV